MTTPMPSHNWSFSPAQLKTRAITMGDEQSNPPQQLLAEKLLLLEYQPAMTCANFIKGQKKKKKYLHLCYTLSLSEKLE